VRSTQTDVPSALDLNTVYEDEFSPDKLGAVLQRLYMTAVRYSKFERILLMIVCWNPRVCETYSSIAIMAGTPTHCRILCSKCLISMF
jgi:hypothetical protein